MSENATAPVTPQPEAKTESPKPAPKRTRRPAAKKAATKAPAKKAPAKREPKPAAEQPKQRKIDIPESERDWSYLAEKEPTDLHADFAAWLQEETGQEIDLKTVQAVCVLRMVYQRSDRNKARAAYRGLDETVVQQRSVHMEQAHQDARKIREEQAAAAEAKKQKAAEQRRARAAAKANQA